MSNESWSTNIKQYVEDEDKRLAADPDNVARYITALVEKKTDKPELVSKLKEFMNSPDEAEGFVDRLDEKVGLFSGSARRTSDRSLSSANRPASPRHDDYSDEEDDSERYFKHRRPRSDKADYSDGRRDYAEGRQSSTDYRHSKRPAQDQDYSENGPKRSMREQDYSRRHEEDRRERSRDSYHSSGPTNSTGMHYEGRSRSGRREGYYSSRPRDYTDRAYGRRNEYPSYDQGAVQPMMNDFSMPPPHFAPPFPYDPSVFVPPGTFRDMPPPMRGGSPFRGRGRGRGGGGGPRVGRKQFTKVLVQNIPQEQCTIHDLDDYFKKFGKIVNINVEPDMQQATLQFADPEVAKAAHSSPDAVFGNRFIKVFYQLDKHEPPSNAPDASSTLSTQPPQTEPPRPSNEPDPEAVAARKAELAKINALKQAKRQESAKALLALQKTREQELQREIDAKKEIMAKLTDTKGMSREEKAALLKSLKEMTVGNGASKTEASPVPLPATPPPPPTAQPSETAKETKTGETAESLKLKLAKLEAEAKTLGIPTDTFKSQPPSYRGGRGGYFSRGRGWPGTPRGGGATRYKLDNRPTSLLVTGISDDIADEARKHFEQLGTLESWEPTESGVVAKYAKRFDAEKAMATGFPKKELQLSWHSTPISSSEPPQPSQTSTDAPAQPQDSIE